MSSNTDGYDIAALGGGCFWCMEAVFKEVKGVIEVDSGYTGGTTVNPTYQEVCTGRTGHAEAVRITFDPEVITYAGILRIFFHMHDPTTLNRQDADVGTQYRSAIYYRDENQKRVAYEVIRSMEEDGAGRGKIVTEVTLLGEFYVAEEYHQDFFERNPSQAYCRAVIAPKVAKMRMK